MYLTAMTHRDELFDLTLRWLNDELESGDGTTISRIFLYESAVSAVVVDRVTALLGNLFRGPLRIERIRQKQALRRRLTQYMPCPGERTRQLIQQFEVDPEYYFPRLPVDALLVVTPDANLVAIGRVKRLSRVAEKVSFRLVDALLLEIQAEARHFATERAAASGVPLSALVSTDDEMDNDFSAAEAAVAKRFRNHNVRIPREALAVNDLLGFKLIGGPELVEKALALVHQAPGVTLVQAEEQVGDYNALKLLVEVDLPPPDELAARLKGFDWSIGRRRGLDPTETEQGFAGYLARGAGAVRMEIILTTYDELMESELGRSMHELRVLRLRQRQTYRGPIAQNAGYLVEYLLALASSPVVEVAELPVKMYGRYLPETIASAKCGLFGNEIDGGLLSAFCLQTDCLGQFCPAENVSMGDDDQLVRAEAEGKAT